MEVMTNSEYIWTASCLRAQLRETSRTVSCIHPERHKSHLLVQRTSAGRSHGNQRLITKGEGFYHINSLPIVSQQSTAAV